MPTSFLSLPSELRQNILFLSHELELTAPTRTSPKKSIEKERLVLYDHIIEADRYMRMLRGIGTELNQVHPSLEDDVEYAVGKWIEGVEDWVDKAEERFKKALTELEKKPGAGDV
ncbi:hypothetical protein E2P81_ATG03669 [Venturia nashicola]|nr:hypothetical protein E2P81_ATG03669 [Venturia nashicola]